MVFQPLFPDIVTHLGKKNEDESMKDCSALSSSELKKTKNSIDSSLLQPLTATFLPSSEIKVSAVEFCLSSRIQGHVSEY